MKNLILITLLSLPALANSNSVNFDPNDIERNGRITLHTDNTISLLSPMAMTTISCRESGYRSLSLVASDTHPRTRIVPLRRLTRFQTYIPLVLMEQGDVNRKVLEACQRGQTRMALDYQAIGTCIKVKMTWKREENILPFE